MHFENRLFWMWLSKEYPRYFNWPSRVVEFGSLNINGSIRNVFKCTAYIGVDWRPGPDVDMVSLAHEVHFAPESVDTVVSASMLEHDPYWKKSLAKMAEVLKKDGLFAISWGAALNPPHHPEAAPDSGFHALKVGLVLPCLEELGLYVHTFKYDRTICKESGDKEFMEARLKNPLYGMGSVALVAFKDKSLAKGERYVEPLIEEDKA